jgi:cell division protein FtsX
MFHYTLAFAACFALATTAFAAKGVKSTSPSTHHTADSSKEKVTFEVTGTTSAQSTAISKALTDNGLTAKVHEGKGKKPMHLAADIDRGADLNQWAKVVGTTAAKGDAAPMLQLVIFAPLTAENSKTVLAELEKVKGVDIKHTAADVKTGEVRVALNGTDKITAEDITTAMQTANVTGHFTKMTSSKTSKI